MASFYAKIIPFLWHVFLEQAQKEEHEYVGKQYKLSYWLRFRFVAMHRLKRFHWEKNTSNTKSALSGSLFEFHKAWHSCKITQWTGENHVTFIWVIHIPKCYKSLERNAVLLRTKFNFKPQLQIVHNETHTLFVAAGINIATT